MSRRDRPEPRASGRRRSGTFVALSLVAVALVGCGSDRVAVPVGSVSTDGRRIGVHDFCHDDPMLDITEDEATIEVELTVATESGGDCFSCTIELLDAPVGDRAVTDAATGKPIPTSGDCFDRTE